MKKLYRALIPVVSLVAVGVAGISRLVQPAVPPLTIAPAALPPMPLAAPTPAPLPSVAAQDGEVATPATAQVVDAVAVPIPAAGQPMLDPKPSLDPTPAIDRVTAGTAPPPTPGPALARMGTVQ